MDKKNIFRKNAKQKLAKYMRNGRIKRDKFVVNKLEKLIRKNRYKNILLYIPLNSEVNSIQLIKKIRSKYNIYVPFMEGISFKMVKFRLPLFRKKFNIREPKNSYAVTPKIDLAIVPVLGVDGAFKRIGFGKGMYDRFFESLKSSPKVVFVQLGECFTQEFLCESHDILADIYITPYKTRINNDNRSRCSRCS